MRRSLRVLCSASSGIGSVAAKATPVGAGHARSSLLLLLLLLLLVRV
jgi:hypothetical protein